MFGGLRKYIVAPLMMAAAMGRTANADPPSPAAPPLPENRQEFKLEDLRNPIPSVAMDWLKNMHARYLTEEGLEQVRRESLQAGGLSEAEIEEAMNYDRRFSVNERIKLLKANISPDEINDYPDFFKNSTIFALYNNGVGPERAKELLEEDIYQVTKDKARDYDPDETKAFLMGLPFRYFEKGQADGKPIQKIISEYNEGKLKQEFGKETVKRFKKKLYIKTLDQCRYEIYQEVMRNFLDPKRNADKPLALCSLPESRSDHNFAFVNNFAPSLVGRTQLWIGQANENQSARLIPYLSKQRGLDQEGKPQGIDVWVVSGHGCRGSIRKAGLVDANGVPLKNKDKYDIDPNDLDFFAAVAPYITGTVILDSCSTANGYKDALGSAEKSNDIIALKFRKELSEADIIHAAPYPITELIYLSPNCVPIWDVPTVSLPK